MSYGVVDQYEMNRAYSPFLSPGISSGNQFIDMAVSMMAGQAIFPQPQGNNSVADMMMARSRNMDYHRIMKRGFASAQMSARMGGIDINSPAYQMLYPLVAQPDSFVWKAMAPLIGGNPVRAQMGLYADLNGQSSAISGRLGSISTAETDQMMDALQGKFYKPANFGKYVQSVDAPLRRILGEAKYNKLDQDWSMSTIRGLEGDGFTSVNRGVGGLLDTAGAKIKKLQGDTSLSSVDLAKGISDARNEAKEAARSFFSEISSPEARKKMSDSFAEALGSNDVTGAAKTFKTKFTGEMQDAYRMAARGADIRNGLVPGGIDYNFTRGFNIEDITGSFGHASRAGLIGRKTGLDITGFATPAIGALDAARGIFGRDLSGRELTEELNKLIGTGYVNMADPGDARKLEELLRNVKSMARIAGVSVESMKGIIDQAKGLASNNPNLPQGLDGLTAGAMAIGAMGEVTTAMTYMDPANQRARGGPGGLIEGSMRRRNQSIAEPGTAHLSALYYQVAMTSGENSPLAKSILAQIDGNNTSAGQAIFFNKTARQMGMSPSQLMLGVENNTWDAQQGMRLAPELARTGENGLRQTLFNQGDAFLGGHAGLTRRLLAIGMAPEYDDKSNADIIAEIKRQFPGLPHGMAERYAMPLLRRKRQRQQDGNGPMDMMEAVGILRIPDNRGAWRDAYANGMNENIARDGSAAIRAKEARTTEMHTSYASMEARYAKQLGAMQAPKSQLLFQGLMDGSIEDGGVASIQEMLHGGSTVIAMDAAMNRLSEARQMYGGTNETEAGALKGLAVLYPGMDINNLLKVGGVAGLDGLRGIGSKSKEAAALAKQLRTGTYTSWSQVEKLFAAHGTVAGAVKLGLDARTMKGPMNQQTLSSWAASVEEETRKTQTDPAVAALAKQKGGTAEQILKAVRDLDTFDPDGDFSGKLSGRNLLDYGLTATGGQLRRFAAGNQQRDLIEKYKALNSKDPAKQLEALRAVHTDVNFKELEPFLKKINIDTLHGINDASDSEEGLRRARNALSTVGMNPDLAKQLVGAARDIGTLDPDHQVTGQKIVGLDAFLKSGRAGIGKSIVDLFYAPGQQEIGEHVWQSMLDSPYGHTGTGAKNLNKIRTEFLGGKGDISALAKLLEKPGMAARIRDSAGGAFEPLMNAVQDYERKSAQMPTGTKEKTGIESLDIPGLIKVIEGLSSAVTKASGEG